MTYRPELWLKLNSLINRYGGDEGFVANMHQWPQTIRKLVFSSPKLMVRFGLTESPPDELDNAITDVGRVRETGLGLGSTGSNACGEVETS